PDDRAGNDPDANLLYKPRVTESGTKLLANRETGFVTGLHSKKSPKFTASNNEADYEALVAGLRIATQIGKKNVQVNVDSKLVANQVLGTYVAKKDNMIKYLEIVQGLISKFTTFSISQVLVEVIENKSIREKEAIAMIKEKGLTWMTQLVDYLKDGRRKIRLKARQYELMPLPEGAGKVKFLIVAMDFFTKWIEAKVVAMITSGQVA
nr:hypothetical protein [Tanacetum cinerariifolium]